MGEPFLSYGNYNEIKFMKVLGIHHVTAVSARIAENLAFYTGILGMRLVKKSVNQDDVSAYHLFYADDVGTPGTDLTFFDWPTIQTNRPGGEPVIPGPGSLTIDQRADRHRDLYLAYLHKIGAEEEARRFALLDAG